MSFDGFFHGLGDAALLLDFALPSSFPHAVVGEMEAGMGSLRIHFVENATLVEQKAALEILQQHLPAWLRLIVTSAAERCLEHCDCKLLPSLGRACYAHTMRRGPIMAGR